MLVEVIAAIAVVGVGLAAFASGIPVAAMAVSEGAQHSTATFLAAARLEEVRGAEWRAEPALDRLGLSIGPLVAPQLNGTITFPDEAALANPYAGFARRIRILDCGLPPGCGAATSPLLRQVTVTVAYRPVTASGLAASDKSVSLTTLVAQR
jgi:hypothetical protein